jgi:FixJ family two-component response regulator
MRRPTVYLYLPDEPHLAKIASLLTGTDSEIVVVNSVECVVSRYDPTSRNFLVISLKIGEENCTKWLMKLSEFGCKIPFVAVTTQANTREVIMAMRHGALDVLEPPFDGKLFHSRVHEGIKHDGNRIRLAENNKHVRQRLSKLTRRQQEILDMVVEGMLTKQIAKQLDVSVKTVEVHRSNITKRMKADSVIHLVRMVMDYRRSNEE